MDSKSVFENFNFKLIKILKIKMSKNYYRTIYSKFWKKVDSAYHSVDRDEFSQKTPEEPDEPNLVDGEAIDYLGHYIGNKREAKSLIKLHEEVIDYYISQTTDVSALTLKKYGRSIADFISFDPTINPEQLENFKKYTVQQMKLGGNLRQYTQPIYKFLSILYCEEINNYNVDSTKFLINENLDSSLSLSPLLLFKLYDILISYNHIQDAVIIHLLYSLTINLKTLCNIRFSDISQYKSIKFYDFSINDVRDFILSHDPFNDLMFYRHHCILKNKRINEKHNRFYIEEEIEYSLINPKSQSMIFNRFRTKFNGKVEWFNYSPEDIFKLSKKMREKYLNFNESISRSIFEDKCYLIS